MATFKYHETFDGKLGELFELFMSEAVKPFDHVIGSYVGTKQSVVRQGIPITTEITGYDPAGLYQAKIQMPDQEFLKKYKFSTVAPDRVRVDYEETFRTTHSILAVNHWLMGIIMKKSLNKKMAMALTPLRDFKQC